MAQISLEEARRQLDIVASKLTYGLVPEAWAVICAKLDEPTPSADAQKLKAEMASIVDDIVVSYNLGDRHRMQHFIDKLRKLIAV